MRLLRLTAACAAVLLAPPGVAQDAPLLPVRIDAARNRVLLEIPAGRLGQDLLYTSTLATGLGSAALPMDRGELGNEAVVRLERHGARVHLVQDNWSVRALGADAAGRRAAAEAFPTSVLAAFPVESETPEAITVDASSLFFADVWGVAERLRGRNQGSFRVDRERSWADTAGTRSFPRNTEVRMVLTLVSDAPGAVPRRVAPEPGAMTLRQHHSLLALPDGGFRPRRFDPRAGLFGVGFLDFGQGIDGDYRGGYASRWRLVPKDTAAYLRGEKVEPVRPIVYHLDPAIPEPYRTAFKVGGSWWNTILGAAGWKNAFQVRDLPAGADPMDARYSVIYWIHRNGTGPSVGPSFQDPRTGEIVKTIVRMDSYRSLVDYNIYAGLLPAAGGTLPVSAEAFTMSRRRQHAAHEIGHTLGFAHNYIASAQGRTSVMDYPFPIIDVDADGRFDLSRAWRDGGGAWDTLTVRYGYTWYPDSASEAAGLRRLMADAIGTGLRWVADQHADASGSNPRVTRWDEGATPFEGYERVRRVRALMVERFDERAVKPGEPLATLNMRYAQAYLFHRYSLESVVKTVGGMDFTYALRGDGQVPTAVLPAADQRRALGLALDALSPAMLATPTRVARLIPPAPPGNDGTDQWIRGMAGPAFDPLTLAGGLATEVVEGLLDRERAARLVLFHAADPSQLSLDTVMQALVERSWGAPTSPDAQERALRRVVQAVVLNTLLDRAGDAKATPDVRAIATWHLQALAQRLQAMQDDPPPGDRAARVSAMRAIRLFFDGQDDPASRSRFPVVPLPWP